MLSWIHFNTLLIAILVAGMQTASTIDTSDEFERQQCIQDDSGVIICQDLNDTDNAEKEHSAWPPGPYFLPMSIYGCPEYFNQGWREGYISIQWNMSFDVYILHDDQIRNDSSKNEQIKKFKSSEWPRQQTMTLGPYTKTGLTLNFCYKHRNRTGLDNGVWPAGNYGIYGDENGCPQGFTNETRNISLPSILSWTTDGFVPNFQIFHLEDSAKLQVSICTRDGNDAYNQTDDWASFIESPFVLLLKAGENSCRLRLSTYQQLMKETILLKSIQNSDTESFINVQEYCYIMKSREVKSLRNEQLEKGYFITTKAVVSGNTSEMSGYDDVPSQSSHNLDYFFQRIGIKKHNKIVPWVLIDLGRSISVSAIQIQSQTDVDYQIKCFISNDKWAFLYFSSLSCLHTTSYESQKGYINLLFDRQMEGRFIALVSTADNEDYTIFHSDGIVPFRVYTQRLNQKNNRCSMYMGISDGSIRDDQIIVSSEQPLYPASGIRPYHKGWCASVQDSTPSVTVDLMETLNVEGIILWNWSEMLMVQDDTAVIEHIYLLGSRHFVVYHGHDLNNLSKYEVDFRFDSNRPYDVEQSFLFKTEIQARFIQLRIMEPFSEGLNCMRFELLGCLSSDLFGSPRLEVSSPQQSLVTIVTTITTETIINNIGGDIYKAGQTYSWIIQFTKFLTIIFTRLSLNEYQEESCRDSLYLSSKLNDNKASMRTIDHDLNGIKIQIETNLKLLVITFESCLATSMQLKQGSGFEALLVNQDQAACFQLDSEVEWNQGRRENCKGNTMTLTSMSFLGLPFRETTEIWTIHVPFKIIQFHIIEFQVTCNEHGSKFTISDAGLESTYCNVRRPPNFISSASDTLIITFYKVTDPHAMYTEGFRASYDTSTVSVEEGIDYETLRSQMKNVAIGKPSMMSSLYLLPASLSNDGVIHPDSWSWTCSNTDLEFEPWWLVDLEAVYILDRVIVNNRRDCVGCALRTENIEVSIGLTLSSMIVTGYHCGVLKTTKLFPQFGARARYVKVQKRNVKIYMNLCEVEVYGMMDSNVDPHFETKFSDSPPVHGNWGEWGTWSEVCTDKNQQRRKRQCNNPVPNFKGNDCDGSNTSYRECSSTKSFQENILNNKQVMFSSREDSNTSCYQTSYQDYPWIEIDLLMEYHLHELMIDNYMEISSLVILYGSTLCDVKEEVFTKCGGTLTHVTDLTGVTARFLKLQVMEEYKALTVCGLRLSGQQAKSQPLITSSTSESDCNINMSDTEEINNEWSFWSNCSSKCGIGTQFRTRHCSNNISYKSGASCQRMHTEYRTCKNYVSCYVCSNQFKKCYNIIPELTNWRHAGHDCWRRKMKLVAINSVKELRFVKQLLRRETQFTHDRPSVAIDSLQSSTSFFAHIGVYRILKKSKIKADYFEDMKPVIFSAWNNGEPSDKSCTRMNFQLFNKDNTWESVDCETDLAEYYVCETKFGRNKNGEETKARFTKFSGDWSTFPEQQIKTTEYTGNINITDTNAQCLSWANLTRENMKQNDMWWQRFFVDEDHSDVNDTETDGVEEEDDNESGLYMYRDYSQGTRYAHNYCRDPGNDGYLGCYTKDGYSPCTFVLPPSINSEMTYYYRGQQNITYSGKTCQRWDADFPHVQELSKYDYNGESLKDKANYCRDPWDTGYLWCYTTDIDSRWEPCIIADSISGRCSRIIQKYSGNLNVTFSGKMCQVWNTILKDTTKTVDNYCRDPFDEGFFWCYTDLTNMDMEPCFPDNNRDQMSGERSYNSKDVNVHFTCTNGDVINNENVCNRNIDCVDLSDETECWRNNTNNHLLDNVVIEETEVKTNGLLFLCGSLEWVSLIAQCDGVIDCLDASDEMNCSYLSSDEQSCREDEFRCEAGDCIHVSQVCDFIVDCTDGSDEFCEMEFCEIDEFKCNNGQCIPADYRCDAYFHCFDGSDEEICETCNENTAFHCDIARCIPKRLVCDKYIDCVDRTDETSCIEQTYSSCDQWWKAGFRTTSHYVINGIDVICNFDFTHSTNVIYTIYNNIDIIWYNETRTGNMYVRESKRESDANFVEAFATGNCYQEIRQKCDYVHSSMATFNERQNSNLQVQCSCAIQTVTKPTTVANKTCNGSMSSGKELVFMYKLSGYFRTVNILSSHSVLYQVQVGNITCISETNHTEDGLICEKDVKVIPEEMRCVYDEDAAGYITGCRSRSHLKNCENFTCPPATAKCPKSYCIPIRFICDGQIQCPGGEDEHICGCNSTNIEMVILVHKPFYEANGDMVEQFARQFYNLDNVIRILSYETRHPFVAYSLNKIQLDINDKQIQPFDVVKRLEDCQYKTLAENFISSVMSFNSSMKGLIFLDTDDETQNVAKELFQKLNYETNELAVYRIQEVSNIYRSVKNYFPFVSNVFIRRWKSLTAMGAEYFSRLCTVTTSMHKPNFFKCSASKTLITRDQVCDGTTHCIHGDDERLCNFKCPTDCKCLGLSVDCSKTNASMDILQQLSKSTRQFDISYNKRVNQIISKPHLNIVTLIRLNLSHCGIENISPFAFHNVRHLMTLDLSFNKLKTLRQYTFEVLGHLSTLNMIGNEGLSEIESNAFSGLSQIKRLELGGGQYKYLHANTFTGLSLEYLNLSNGVITEIEPLAFNDLSVEHLDIDKNDLETFHQDMFNGVFNLKTLQTPRYKFCCVRPSYMREEDCLPLKDEFSSCDDLMRLSALQTMLWFIGLTAFIGNLLSIFYRLKYDKQRLRLGFGIFVTNLAVADFLMSLYLIIIAVADAVFRNRYIFMDDYWRSSIWCKIAGILSTISSEASILFICFITIDRLLVVKYPFGQFRFNKSRACVATAFVWLISIAVAILPVIYVSYFQDKFYSKSGVCIALPLTRDRPPGWMYSVSIFVGLNFATFVLVAMGQWFIFSEIKSTKIKSAILQTKRQRDLKVARNLLLVVATDFLCWFPIGVMGMMALQGHVISGDVYAWSAVFLLPINSALNPVLYTVTAILGKKKFTPNSDEQFFRSSEIGIHRLQTFKIGRFFHDLHRHTGQFMSISAILDNNMIVPTTRNVLIICYKLVEGLDNLHSSSMYVGNLSADKVLVYVRNNKIIGDVRFRGEPCIMNTMNDNTSEEIYQMGLLIRSLYKSDYFNLKVDIKRPDCSQL